MQLALSDPCKHAGIPVMTGNLVADFRTLGTPRNPLLYRGFLKLMDAQWTRRLFQAQ